MLPLEAPQGSNAKLKLEEQFLRKPAAAWELPKEVASKLVLFLRIYSHIALLQS